MKNNNVKQFTFENTDQPIVVMNPRQFALANEKKNSSNII